MGKLFDKGVYNFVVDPRKEKEDLDWWNVIIFEKPFNGLVVKYIDMAVPKDGDLSKVGISYEIVLVPEHLEKKKQTEDEFEKLKQDLDLIVRDICLEITEDMLLEQQTPITTKIELNGDEEVVEGSNE